MLRGLMEHYRKSCKVVSVIARSKKDLEKLEKRYPGIIRGIAVDYLDVEELRKALKESTDKNGRFDVAAAWMEDATAAASLLCVMEFTGTPEKKGRFIHVRGSAAADPALPAKPLNELFTNQEMFTYQEIVLGFVKEGTVSRWLDHEEITEGILDAVKQGKTQSVVGTVTPWADRPVRQGRPAA